MRDKLHRRLGLCLVVSCSLAIAAPRAGAEPDRFYITSPQQEAAMGGQAFEEMKKKKKISQDPEAVARVNRVVHRLVQQLPREEGMPQQWEVVVFEDDEPNAFALPGGKIGVHTGILKVAANDDQLATVIGHEIGHVTQRHAGERIREQLGVNLGLGILSAALAGEGQATRQNSMIAAGLVSQLGLTLPWGRRQEYEADRVGMIYAARAGYDPREAPHFWRRMQAEAAKRGGKPPEFLSTHPSDDNRVKRLTDMLPEVMPYYMRFHGDNRALPVNPVPAQPAPASGNKKPVIVTPRRE